MSKTKLCVLISGGASTARAILEASKSADLADLEVVAVIASSNKIMGIPNLIDAGFNAENIYVEPAIKFKSEEEHGEAILRICEKHEVDLIGQYGWLSKTPENVVREYEGRMINQHPGPLDPGYPDFGGRGMYGSRVVAARMFYLQEVFRNELSLLIDQKLSPEKSVELGLWTEATAQRVGVEYDQGAILKTAKLGIQPQELVSIDQNAVGKVHSRLLPLEHKLQISTLRDLVSGSLQDFVRDERLISEGKLDVLKEAKQKATGLYTVRS